MNAEQRFHTHRKMFYLHQSLGIPVWPAEQYENLSHAEWFAAIGIDIESVVRGYVKDDILHIYTGSKFEVPYDLKLRVITGLCNYFPDVRKIRIGVWEPENQKPGEPWTPVIEYTLTHSMV